MKRKQNRYSTTINNQANQKRRRVVPSLFRLQTNSIKDLNCPYIIRQNLTMQGYFLCSSTLIERNSYFRKNGLSEPWGSCFRQLAFGKSCHQPASFSHRSLAHSTENRCLHFIKKVLTIPYTRPKTKEGFMKKTEVIYDKYYDCYLCPGVQELPHCTTTKEGYRQYVSYPLHCKECPLLSQCTQSKNHQKLIQRHVWEQHRVFENRPCRRCLLLLP